MELSVVNKSRSTSYPHFSCSIRARMSLVKGSENSLESRRTLWSQLFREAPDVVGRKKRWYVCLACARHNKSTDSRQSRNIAYVVPVDSDSFVPGEATSSTTSESAADVSNPPRLSHPVDTHTHDRYSAKFTNAHTSQLLVVHLFFLLVNHT
jgi:hypothetical protein